MSSLLKIIRIITIGFAWFGCYALHAQAVSNEPLELITTGIYPTYPATTPATGNEQQLIQRGEYLAKMGDCIACHTDVKARTPAFAGGLPLATPFGTFYSPNITPDKETGIGNWTEKDFIRALKEGRDPQGRNYFPVFPYIYFSKMTDDDARALYAYFMHIPAVSQKNKSLPFPFGVPGARTSLWGWNLLFFFPDKSPIDYQNDQSAEWNRGKYIVEGLGHCGMCHTPLNLFGGPKTKYYLTGAFIDGYWAPNITKSGLNSATHIQIADVFKSNQLINNAGPVAGPMAEVNHNSLAHLTEADRTAIAVYLKTVESEQPLGVSPSSMPPSITRGRQIYMQVCSVCHQDSQMSAPVIGNSPNWAMRLRSSGLTGLYRHTIHGFNSMPIKGACVTCSDNDLISAVDYMLNASLSAAAWVDLKNGGALKFPANGENVYMENCSVCHTDSNFGAPRIGDKQAWKPLIAKNMDVLIKNVIQGNHHLKKGGCDRCTTAEVIEAIKYIVSQSKSKGNYSLW